MRARRLRGLLAACQRARQGPGKHAFIGAAREGAGEGGCACASYVTPLNFRRVKSGFMVSIILLIARGWQA